MLKIPTVQTEKPYWSYAKCFCLCLFTRNCWWICNSFPGVSHAKMALHNIPLNFLCEEWLGGLFFSRSVFKMIRSCPRGLLLFQLNMTCTWRAELNVIHAPFFVWVMNFQPLDFIWINKSHQTIYSLWKNEIRQYVIFCHLRLVKKRKIKTNWFVNFLKFFYFYVKGAKNRPLRWEEQRGTNFYGRHSATDVSKM